MERSEIVDINNHIIDSILTCKKLAEMSHTATKYKICSKGSTDIEQLRNVPNPKNNQYSIRNLRDDVNNFLQLNSKETIFNPTHKHPKLDVLNNNYENEDIRSKLDENMALEKCLRWTLHRNNLQRIQQRNAIPKSQQSVIDVNFEILLRHFNKWKLNVKYDRNLRKMKLDQNVHRNKITNFLQVLKEQKEAMANESVTPKVVRSAVTVTTKSTARNPTKPVSAPLLLKRTLAKALPPPVDKNLVRIERELDRSIMETKQEIRSITFPKLKNGLIQTESKELLKLIQKVPENITKSIEMAKDREERRKQILERKHRAEDARLRYLEDAEEQRKLDEMDKKRRQVTEFREKRRKEQENACRLAEERERWRCLKERAITHYQNKLLRRSFQPFLNAVESNCIKLKAANGFYEISLLQNHFTQWQVLAMRIVHYKKRKADAMFELKILSRTFQAWKEVPQANVLLNQVADDYCDMKILIHNFTAWQKYTSNQFWHWQSLSAKASVHYRWKVIRQYLHYWKIFPAIIKVEREKFQSKQKWIQRVQELLPNFQPLSDF